MDRQAPIGQLVALNAVARSKGVDLPPGGCDITATAFQRSMTPSRRAPRVKHLAVNLLVLAMLPGSVGVVAGDVQLGDDGVAHHPVYDRSGGNDFGEDALPIREHRVEGDAQGWGSHFRSTGVTRVSDCLALLSGRRPGPDHCLELAFPLTWPNPAGYRRMARIMPRVSMPAAASSGNSPVPRSSCGAGSRYPSQPRTSSIAALAA